MKQFIQIVQQNLSYRNKFACLSQLPALLVGSLCYIASYNGKLQFIPSETTITVPAFAEFAKIHTQYYLVMGTESDAERGSGRIREWLMG